MPRSLSSDLQTQVSATATKTAFLVELNLSSTIRLTDWYSNVVYDSNTYEAGGSFLSVDAVTETGQLEVTEMTIGFSNVTDQVRTLVQSGAFTDKIVDVYLAYFNTSETIVGAITYFTGQIRSVSIEENINSSTLSLVVASHWANWNLTKGRHYSDESQQKFSTGDRGMEFATQVKENVRWGM
jgi:hypothetical protein|tara:strand:- start:208 stop:756 length:549 start_codon:yes stop_codon:yes gene_type:complete